MVIGFVLFWGSIAFVLLIAASYVGTKLALRSYFDDEPPISFASGSYGPEPRDEDGGR